MVFGSQTTRGASSTACGALEAKECKFGAPRFFYIKRRTRWNILKLGTSSPVFRGVVVSSISALPSKFRPHRRRLPRRLLPRRLSARRPSYV
ncbi:hypothetical protein U1Q18_049595 [Sarracenia purpurea var. burkii]